MNKSLHRRLDRAAQGAEKLPPRVYTPAENREWAEQQIAEMMRDHRLSRNRAIALAQEHAPTIAAWLTQEVR